MGYGSWSDDTQRALSNSRAGQTRSQTFANTAQNTISANMAPDKLVLRESRDSVEHPNSLGIIVNLDETGSMGSIPHAMVNTHLTTLMSTMIKHGLPDVQVMFNAIGDHKCDKYPLQVGQFESETTKINHWLTEFNLEGNGGGNGGESYLLAWFFAARYTSMDCFEKRGEKGVLFTIGDERCHPGVKLSEISTSTTLRSMLTAAEVTEFTAKDILAEAQRSFHVYHIVVNGGQEGGWRELLGENVIVLPDESTIAEVIAATTAMIHGADLDAITADFDSATAATVTTALAKVSANITKKGNSDGVIVL